MYVQMQVLFSQKDQKCRTILYYAYFMVLRIYDIQKIKRYRKLELQYDYTIGILLNSNFIKEKWYFLKRT